MRPNLQNVAVGFAEVADGLLSIVSLGMTRYNFAFRLTVYFELRKLMEK